MTTISKLLSSNAVVKLVPSITYPYYIERISLKRIKIYYRAQSKIIHPAGKDTYIQAIIISNNKKYIDILILLMINNRLFDYNKHGIWVPVRGIFRIINKNKSNIIIKLNK